MEALARMSVLGFAVVIACATAHSQTVLYSFNGDSWGDHFGNSVSGAGDVNGDGFGDVIVGADVDDNNGPASGSARVFSGIDGSVLYSFDGDSAVDYFGRSVSGAGDVNGDGFDDLIVGAPEDDNNGSESGMARVFSGRDGSVLYTLDGDSPYDYFGWAVSGAGDVNGDGYDDLIVGAPLDDNNSSDSGSARVFSGVDGSILYTFDGDSAVDQLGGSVGAAGDVNRDGYADLIVGAFRDDNNGDLSGSARVFSGVDGSTLYTFDGDSPGDAFGVSVSGAGDVNGDGFDDLIGGANGDDNNGQASGSARVFSGVDGSVLYTFDGDSAFDHFGSSVSGAGDVNADGFDDVIVGAPFDDNNGPRSGSARVFSGVDGSALYTFDGYSMSDSLGRSVSDAGNVNADGFDDVIVGTPNYGPGVAFVISSRAPIGVDYCPAALNSTGLAAAIAATGSEVASSNDVALLAQYLPQNQVGYFLNSTTQEFVFPVPNSQGSLCIGGQIGRYAGQVFHTGPAGTGWLGLDLTTTPTPSGSVSIQPGDTWNFQCWYTDDNPGSTSNFTNALSVTFR